MTTKPLFEQLLIAVAPAVTKYHLDLQLSDKSEQESEFLLHPDTGRFIAEDAIDIAHAIMEELEAEKESPRKAKVKAAVKKEGAEMSETKKASATKASNGSAAKTKAAPAKTKAVSSK